MEDTDVRALTDYRPYAEAQERVRDLNAALSIHEGTKEEARERVQELQDQLDEAQVEELLDGNDEDESEAVQIIRQGLNEARQEVQAVEDKIRVHRKALKRAKEKAAEELPKAKKYVGDHAREMHERAVQKMIEAAAELAAMVDTEEELTSRLRSVLANGGPTQNARISRFITPLGNRLGDISVEHLIATAQDAGYDVGDAADEVDMTEYRRTHASEPSPVATNR